MIFYKKIGSENTERMKVVRKRMRFEALPSVGEIPISFHQNQSKIQKKYSKTIEIIKLAKFAEKCEKNDELLLNY